MEKPPVFQADDVLNIKRSYDANGFVCVLLLKKEECDELVLEQCRELILAQPWTDEYKIKVQGPDGRELDVNRPEDQPEFLKQVVGPMTPARRKKFEAGWPLHRGFGASCDPVVFHLPGVWRVRQNEKLYKVTSTLTGEPRLWVDINRSIQKLPGQGNNEFLHFDYNPFALAKQKEQDNAAKAPRAVCGKICYTRSRFVCVPGTHTRSFLEEFVEKYAELYPHVKQSDKKVALDKGKADPLNLIARQKYYEIPPGCGIFWDDKLLHGQIKTPLDANAEYGAYIGMFPAGSRPGYRKVCRVDELDDRLRSYHEGCAPKLWPSLDEIRFYPKKFDNFPQLMEAYLNKLPPDHPMITTRTTKLGKQVRCLRPLPNPNYKPPELTELGKRLLGLLDWPEDGAESAPKRPKLEDV